MAVPAAQSAPTRSTRPVGEGHVVDRAQQRVSARPGAADGQLAGAVAAQPGAQSSSLMTSNPCSSTPSSTMPGQRRDAGVDRGEVEAQLGIAIAAWPGHDEVQSQSRKAFEQPDQQAPGGPPGGRSGVVGVARTQAGEALGQARAGVSPRSSGPLEQLAGQIAGEVLEPVGHQVVAVAARRAAGRRGGRAARASPPAPSRRPWRRSPRRSAARPASPGRRRLRGQSMRLACQLAVDEVVEDELIAALEGVLEVGERAAGRAAQLAVGIAHQRGRRCRRSRTRRGARAPRSGRGPPRCGRSRPCRRGASRAGRA